MAAIKDGKSCEEREVPARTIAEPTGQRASGAMGTKFNEEAVCRAIRELFENIQGEACTETRKPDEIGEEPPVDLRCRLADKEHVIEHTGLPLHRTQLRDDARNEKLRNKLEASVTGKLAGPGAYTVGWPHAMRLHRKNRKSVEWLNELAEEIRCVGAAEHAELSRKSEEYRRVKQNLPEGRTWSAELEELREPYRETTLAAPPHAPEARGFWLRCHAPIGPWKKNPPLIDVIPTVSAETLGDYSQEVKYALDKKEPKLSEAKKQQAVTTLVLETTSFMYFEPTDVLAEIHRQTAERPEIDHIYLVETRKELPWGIWSQEGIDGRARHRSYPLQG